MEILVDLIKELTQDDRMMWVIGGGAVVSENHSVGMKEPEITPKWITIEAENWHFHLGTDVVDDEVIIVLTTITIMVLVC